MINRTNRAIASVLAFFLVISMVFAPALTASADDLSATSAELVISTEGLDINAKLAMDVNAGLALLAAMGSEGETLMNLGLYLTNNGLVVESSPLLEQAYGINPSMIAENMPKSVFAPDSGSSLALDQGTYDFVMNLLQPSAEAAPAATDALPVDMEVVMGAVMAYMNFIEQHSEAATAALMGSAEMSMAPTTLTILGQEVDVSLTTMTFGPEALNAFIQAISDDLAADGSEVVESLAALCRELVAAGVEIEPAEIAGDDGAAVLAQGMTDTFAQIQQVITESNISVVVNVAADKTTASPVCISASVKASEQEAGIVLVLMDDTYGVVVNADGSSFGAYLVIEEVSDTGFSGYITTQVDESEVGRLALSLDFATGAYSLAITSNGETINATGTVGATEDGGFMITLETMDGQEFPGTLALVLRDADVISVPEFAEILTMSEEELTSALQGVMTMVQSLLSMVGIA